MPARTGAQFLQGLRDRPRDLWIEGQRVADSVDHPAFRNVVRSVAALYDMQHDPTLRDVLTYESPTSGERVGMSFLEPKTHVDLVRRDAPRGQCSFARLTTGGWWECVHGLPSRRSRCRW